MGVLRRTQVAGEHIGTRKGGKGTHMDQSDNKPLVEGCPAATACVGSSITFLFFAWPFRG